MTLDKPEVSIIIPCYNCENTLSTALKSLENQTFRNFEVILVNDGSTDKTDEIIQNKLSSGALTFRYIKQENAGVSSARNAGLGCASGNYIMFLDADDVYNAGAVEELYNLILSADLEIAYCKFTRNINAATKKIKSGGKVKFRNQTQMMNDFMYRYNTFAFVCFIYKKELLDRHQISFSNGAKYGEDREFAFKYLANCSRGALVNKKLYGYWNNPKSAVNTASWDKTDSLKTAERIETYLLERKCDYYPIFKSYMYARVMWSAAKTFSICKRKDLYDRLLVEYDVKRCMKSMLKAPDWIVRFGSLLFCIHPSLFYSAISVL